MTKQTKKPERQGVGGEAELLPATETAQAGVSDEASLQHPDSDARTDSPNRRRPDVKACASPSPEEVKDRIIAARNRGPSSPLYALAQAEADLHARSAALALDETISSGSRTLTAEQLIDWYVSDGRSGVQLRLTVRRSVAYL